MIKAISTIELQNDNHEIYIEVNKMGETTIEITQTHEETQNNKRDIHSDNLQILNNIHYKTEYCK